MRVRIFVSGSNLEQVAKLLEANLERTECIEVVDLWEDRKVVECVWDGVGVNLLSCLGYILDATNGVPIKVHKALVTY